MKRIKVSTATIVNLILIFYCVICLIPMLLTISISITDNKILTELGYNLIPKKISFAAYTFLFKFPKDILNGYKNSLIVTIVGTFFNLILTATIAYPLSRKNFKTRNVISAFVFFTMIFNGGLVPLYILIVKYFHWKDMLIALIVPGMVAPFNIFLLRVFFQDIPDSLIEAAKIDGSSEWNTFLKIILPLSKAALTTLGLIIALGYWNDVFNPMLYIDSQLKYPIQLVLNNIQSFISFLKSGTIAASGNSISASTVPTDSMMYALLVITAAPIVFLFTFLQKYFVKGITAGSVKG